MKLTELKGIANNLASHLDSEFSSGKYKDNKNEINTNILEKKDSFDKECFEFFKKQLLPPFDFNRIKEIKIIIKRSKFVEGQLKIKVGIKVDNKEFSIYSLSISANHNV